MSERLRRALPVVAVVAAALVLVSLAYQWVGRQRALRDTGETRRVVESGIEGLLGLHPAELSDPGFLDAAVRTARSKHVVGVWLVDPECTVVYSSGGLARAGDNVAALATAETRRILGELPAGGLAPAQRLQLLTASALQAEGEHNDVFSHLVRAITGPDGSQRGVLGLTYEASAALSAPPTFGTIAAVLVFALGFIIYWLALPAWVYLDARRSGERAVPWTIFVLVSNLVALIAYLLVRQPRAAAGGA